MDFNSHTPHGVRLLLWHSPPYPDNFNSHTPHGVRLLFWDFPKRLIHFNSHTPHGVRRFDTYGVHVFAGISTHTPHTGCDIAAVSAAQLAIVFQLTHPTRGATLHIVKNRVATTKWNGPKQSFVYFSA